MHALVKGATGKVGQALIAHLSRGPYVSNWMDNSRAKAELGWRPSCDLRKLIDFAWAYQRSPNEPRRVWYPG